MVNPGVITLASLNEVPFLSFPYRFCVEDNIGEAIHIHYKDIRIDLSVEEFERISSSCIEIIDKLVNIKNFHCKDFDPVVLVGIAGNLPKLKKIQIKKVFLEDILVDTFDCNGKAIYAPINQSRVFKALCGLTQENNNRKEQINHYKNNSIEYQTNQERILYNLNKIKKYGYPYNNELIGVKENNQIWDGQHRAACLYYLYGNIQVPVRTLVYGQTKESSRPQVSNNWIEFEHNLWEQANSKKIFKNSIKIKQLIWNILTKFFWNTWRKSEHDKNESFDKTKEINNRLITIEEKMDDLINGR